MSKHIKYPSINQYRNVIKCVIDHAQYTGKDENDNPIFDRTIDLPTLSFKGTPKLHGSNASVVIYPNGSIQAQSRNRIITPGKDNAGFAKFVYDLGEEFWKEIVMDEAILIDPLTIYGEWCGEGIMKGVAISELPKMFVIFSACHGKADDRIWFNIGLDIHHDHNEKQVYSIDQFESYLLDINFRNPQMHQNELIYMTEQVEAECPVGKFFGVSGTGEGIVWKCTTEGYEDSRFWFKVKGEKHSVSKVKTLAEVDIVKLKTIEEFGDRVVTDGRLRQGIDYLKENGLEPSQKTTGQFLSWVFGDIMKEECDVLEENGLTKKDLGKSVGTRARDWYFKYLDKEAMK